jgi:hypothetical protein
MSTITKFNGTNYVQWATKMAAHCKQIQVYGIINGYDNEPEKPAANITGTAKATFKNRMNRYDADILTILLGMVQRIEAEY